MNNLIGKRFGRLEVVALVDAVQRRWLCRCDCGETSIVSRGHLTSGGTRSCGCLQRETMRHIGFDNERHGHARKGRPTSEYGTWIDIRRRCTNAANARYKDYGARGITVRARWRESFDNFFADMGPKPGREYTIERIDSDRGYEPGNCRWATRTEQANNRRGNRILEYGGVSKTMAEWARAFGMDRSTLWHRLLAGWSVERALTEPVKRR